MSTALVPSTGGAIIVPPHYRPDALDYICDQVVEGRKLVEICDDKDVPSVGTVKRWLTRNEEFNKRYLKAFSVFLTIDAPNIIAIADGVDNPDETTTRSQLRVTTRLRLLEKLAPEHFGDKVQVAGNPAGAMMAFIAAVSDTTPKGVDIDE